MSCQAVKYDPNQEVYSFFNTERGVTFPPIETRELNFRIVYVDAADDLYNVNTIKTLNLGTRAKIVGTSIELNHVYFGNFWALRSNQ
ncbi:MAG: hypothetical protein U0T83_04195 [Bacteriovoracaceae bacterium]